MSIFRITEYLGRNISKRYTPTIEDILNSEKFTFELGYDFIPYIVFETNCYSWEYSELVFGDNYSFGGGIAHFGGYENAVALQTTIGL